MLIVQQIQSLLKFKKDKTIKSPFLLRHFRDNCVVVWSLLTILFSYLHVEIQI